jgi:DsbC/DsbD-like thiol-disulfide interchange protein/cytochrome c biogenesis protein CcdA
MLPLRLLPILLLLPAGNVASEPVRTEHVEAELIAATTAIEPGKPLAVALRLKMIPRWHTYWRNPGDSGEPTALEWKLPAGWSAGPIHWPPPQRLPAGPLMNFGYEDEVLLLTDISVPANASGNAKLGARASWLVCNEEHCIPEEAHLALSLPVGAGQPSSWTRAIAETRAALPVKADALGAWRFAAQSEARQVALKIVPPKGIAPKSLVFFPFDEGKIENAGAQSFARSGEGFVLRIPKAVQPAGAFTRVAGVLIADRPLRPDGPRAVEIDVPVVIAASAERTAGLGLAIAFAFAGGLILNLMPCVLPVLSIKVLGFAGPNARDRSAMRLHGVLYGVGVLVSFWAFAGMLIALKSLGAEIGWGFQLQSPVFVALLGLLFLALALNLSGVFEFRRLLPQRLTDARSGCARTDAFLSGALAVAIASPCTAPFMGTALGYALAESAPVAWTVFTALGLGMAGPYVLLAWNPQWLRRVPKPGAWMVRLRRVLAIPLYATVIWLAWVLGIQSGLFAPGSGKAGAAWEPYSEARLSSLVAAGQPVFVDFTAAWCVTCQVNKQLVLGRPEVERMFRDRGITLLRADWTRRDDEITRALAALGRNGVPVYAFYRPGREPQLLPEILTRDALAAALDTNAS